MSNSYFQFKQFIIQQDRCAMKVTTDGCLFGAWVGNKVRSMRSEVRTVLDIGTGTGLLPLMIAQQCTADITAVEIDKDAFQQASENVAASRWADRIKVLHADARKFKFPNQYDMIISNPPFYEKELKGDDTKKNIALHDEGLLLPELLAIIKKNLKPGGSFFLLLPYKRNEEIRKMLSESDLSILQLIFVRQSTLHNYFRIMISGKIKTDETVETRIDEITIKDRNDEYNSDFFLLLKDYYLHL